MKSKPSPSTAATPLRRRAEVRLRRHSSGAEAAKSPADTARLLHELQVHQVELEMQNEELQKARDEMEAGLEKYSDLYDFAPVGFFTFTPEGVITQVNLTGCSLLGIERARLIGQYFIRLVAPESRAAFPAFLQDVFAVQAKQAAEFALLRPGQPPRFVSIEARRSSHGPECRAAVMDITARKQAEAELRVSDERYRTLFSSIDEAFCVIEMIFDPQGRPDDYRFLEVNPTFERHTGLPNVVGKRMRELIPDIEEHWIQIYGEVALTGDPIRFVNEAKPMGGRWFDVYACRVGGSDSRKVAVIFNDISARLKAEEKMRVSETRYRRLFEAAHDGVLLLDPVTRKITEANPFMTKLLGYPRDQLVGKELFEIGLLKDESASQEMFRKLKRKHEVRYEDLPLEGSDGRHQEVEVVANLYLESGHPVIQCNIRDITARKQGEDALRRSEERYRTLFNSIDEGFCVIELIFDRKGRPVDYRFIEINPSFEQQTGIKDGLGKRMLEIAPNAEAFWFELYGRVALTGRPVRYSNEMKGLHRWFDVYAFRLGGPDSRNVAVLFSDITERRGVEADLRKARTELSIHAAQLEKLVGRRTAQLTATNRALEVSITSIQLSKDELRSLLLASESMQRKLRHMARQIITAQEDERRKISRDLHDDVVQTLVSINVELEALNQGAPGGPRFQRKIVRTQRLVEKSVNTVHQFARELRPALLDDLGLIPALHAHIKQVAARTGLKIHLTAYAKVENLTNHRRTALYRVALEALTNVVRHAHASRVTLTVSKLPGAVCMEIHDNGKSFQVPPDLGVKTSKRLGLLGMRERVEMVDGTLTVTSRSGKGTTVRAEIPFKPQHPTK